MKTTLLEVECSPRYESERHGFICNYSKLATYSVFFPVFTLNYALNTQTRYIPRVIVLKTPKHHPPNILSYTPTPLTHPIIGYNESRSSRKSSPLFVSNRVGKWVAFFIAILPLRYCLHL